MGEGGGQGGAARARQAVERGLLGARWPYASLVALATTATAWPAAGYGALVIAVAGDFAATGSRWIFGWPFLTELLIANALHFLLVGVGRRVGIPPLVRDIATLDEAVRHCDRLATLDAATLRAARRAAARFPVWNGAIGVMLAVGVVAASAGFERHAAGPGSPNIWVIVRSGCYACALYGAASLALAELLTRPVCRELRRACAAANLEPYDPFAIAHGWRIVAMVLPTVTALVVAAEIGLAHGGGTTAYVALIVLSALVALGLGWLQYENNRSAVREFGAACRELAAGHDAALITGSIDTHVLEMAREFTTAARRVGDDRRASGERYRALFESALDCIVTMDRAGRIVEFNPAAERTFGRSRAEVLGQPMADAIMPPALRDAHRRGLARYLAAGAGSVIGRRVEMTAIRADGTEFPIELAVTRIRGDGAPVFTGFLRDITDRKRAEAALTESQRLAEQEAEIAAALVHVGQALSEHLDQPDLLERVNRLAIDLLACDWSSTFIWDERRNSLRLHANVGSKADLLAEVEQMEFTAENTPIVAVLMRGELVEVTASSAQQFVPPALLAHLGIRSMLAVPIMRRQRLAGVLLNGHRVQEVAFSTRQRRLAVGIAQATAVALENARLISDLQAASRVKSEFLSTMSHELRTPLNVVLGYVEMARDERLAERDRHAALGRVEAAGRDLLQLIESTLEIGRIEAGRDDVRLVPVPLGAFWADLGRACARLPRRDGVRLDWRPAPPGVTLLTDPRKLTVVIRNLVGNALKFTEAGSVSALLEVDGEQLVLQVADTGIGIRPEDHEAVFEMFRQADGSDSRRHGGTGLGLYLVRRFVQQLGGTVVLESTPGVGTSFTVTLPRGQSGAVPIRAAG